MSCTELVHWNEAGEVDGDWEFRNSHGGAVMIWNALWDRYLYDDAKVSESYVDRIMFPLYIDKYVPLMWPLVDNPEVWDFERIALATTFDKVIVRHEDFRQVAEALSMFYVAHSRPGWACSLQDQADVIASLGPGWIAWNQTSVNGNRWTNYYDKAWKEGDDEDGEDRGRRYDPTKDRDHGVLFVDIIDPETMKRPVPAMARTEKP